MITLSIDLSKIDKSRIKKTEKGQQFYNIVVDTRQSPDNYGNTHTVYESQSKEERAAKKPKNYIGNGKEYVFNGNNSATPAVNTNVAPAQNAPTPIDDLPF
jgi:hypothetical protein